METILNTHHFITCCVHLHIDTNSISLYTQHTSKAFLCFDGDKLELQTFLDADMARHVDSRKSLSGYFLTFARGAISWQSRLQQCVTLSITEVKYIAITGSWKKAL